MSRKGNCWDHSPIESFWGRLKTACIHGYRFATRDQARQTVKDWMVALDTVVLPYVPQPLRRINLLVTGQQRVGLVGPNGAGKSTLLQVIAGRIDAISGVRKVTSRVAYLDQRLDLLDSKRSAIEQLQGVNHLLSEGELRMRLAQLGLDTLKAAAPTGSLSGGERLKAALACVIYAAAPPQLLLLDEPSNHLDLPSLAALEALLLGYCGALIVVSHDQVFLKRLRLTDLLYAGPNGWEMKPAETFHARVASTD